jgi:hypothetical protein
MRKGALARVPSESHELFGLGKKIPKGIRRKSCDRIYVSPDNPSPGQLWKNIRTGEVLFIYRENAQYEGIWDNGRKKRSKDLINMEYGKDGWKCVYTPCTRDDMEKSDSHSYEYRSL